MELRSARLAEQDELLNECWARVDSPSRRFGLGRLFQGYREGENRSTKNVRVFRSLAEASAFLKIEEAPPLPPLPPGVATEKR
jgi:hypothetical protein